MLHPTLVVRYVMWSAVGTLPHLAKYPFDKVQIPSKSSYWSADVHFMPHYHSPLLKCGQSSKGTVVILLMWLCNSFIEFWPSQPTLSIFFYLGQVFQFGTFNFCLPFLTSSTKHVFGLPIGLLEIRFQEYIAFTILVPCILSMWPSQLSLCARMKFIYDRY